MGFEHSMSSKVAFAKGFAFCKGQIGGEAAMARGCEADYLRKLGALDDSDPQQPQVIMANYMMVPC